jgi:hypothetical protein
MIKIVEYKNEVLVGKPCFIEESFMPKMDLLCFYAKQSGIKLYIISSYRKSTHVSGAIVDPAKMGNHLIGHAIDCDLVDGKIFWNSIKMREGLTGNAKKFIDLVISGKILRWGGLFHEKDEVHYDDGLNLSNPEKWHEIHNYLIANNI